MLLIFQRGLGGSGGGAGCEVGSKHESSEDSSEDEAAELRRRHLTPGTQDQPDTASHHSYTEGRTVIRCGPKNIWIQVEKYLLTFRLFPAPQPTGPSCRRCGLSRPTCPPSRWAWRRAAAAAWCGPARSRSRGWARWRCLSQPGSRYNNHNNNNVPNQVQLSEI